MIVGTKGTVFEFNISGSSIVWAGSDGNDSEIYFYNGKAVTQFGCMIWRENKMSRPKIKILIIDDEKVILEMLHQMLSPLGFLVDTAETGGEGIKKISCHSYDLIITDIKMPGMSGNDLFQYLRGNRVNEIPIIAMSGTPWLLQKSNFNAVIAKPFLIKDLLGAVGQFVQNPFTA